MKKRIFLAVGVLVLVCLHFCFSPYIVQADEWKILSAYTTYFNQKEGGRSENIAISASFIDGVTLQPYGEFSFNQTVGKRTEKAGFQRAKIIVGGEYVEGVGGGVCQVSTTLYNCALKSGLTVTEVHPHSLLVSYVAPSRDAMVSSQNDLKLYNPHPFPVRFCVRVEQGAIKAKILGQGLFYRYEIVSERLEEIAPPAPVIKVGETEGVLRAEKSGLKSRSYLEIYSGNNLISRKCLRVDEYRAIQGIIVKKIQNIPD